MAAFGAKAFLVLVLTAVAFSESSISPITKEHNKKFFKKVSKKESHLTKPHKHKDTEDFVKKLEYDVLKKGENAALDYGLAPVDLNLLQDQEFAQDVIEGVEEEFSTIDQEFGDTGDASTKNETKAGPISAMHLGIYIPSAEYNSLIDGLVNNAKRDIVRREMDPLYFNIHNKGVVRHQPRRKERTGDPAAATQPKPEDKATNQTSSKPLGVGIIKGLKKLKRFGNAESRKDGNATLIRSHYFFGPLNIGFIFETKERIQLLNTTLPSLAAHALIKLSNVGNSTSIEEFIIDSPMKYEIQLQGAKNRRFRRLSNAAISRLFKRGGRMERRLERSFTRGIRKPIRKADQKGSRSTPRNKGRKKTARET